MFLEFILTSTAEVVCTFNNPQINSVQFNVDGLTDLLLVVV